jgi:recombination protein RecA
VPFGRQMEVSGPEDSGKTTLCAQIAAETQEKGGLVLVTDTEEKIAHDYWEALGVDTTKILHIKATDLQDVFNKQYRAMQVAREAAADRNILMIWDSLGGTAGAEMIHPDSKNNPMEEASKFGMRRAKVISDGMELVNTIVSKTRVCYLFTNHEYMKYDVKFGSPRETRGGGKPKYFATVRLQLTPVGNIKEVDPNSTKEQTIGKRVSVRALKNHMSGLLLQREAVVMYKRGFVDSYTVFDVGKRLGLVKLRGSWGEWTTPQGEVVKFQGFKGFETKVAVHLEYSALRAAVEEAL